MTIGSRLKEERLRLKRTQAEFAALASSSKGALINWEKDVSSPPATALLAFFEAGANVTYILTGSRPDEDAEAQLDQIEEHLSNPGPEMDRSGLSVEELRGALRIMLENFATGPASDPVRARADEILRMQFNDEAAAKRRSQRYAAMKTRLDSLSRDLDDALDALDVKLPRVMYHHLLTLATGYQINVRDLVPLLNELARLISRSREVEEQIDRR